MIAQARALNQPADSLITCWLDTTSERVSAHIRVRRDVSSKNRIQRECNQLELVDLVIDSNLKLIPSPDIPARINWWESISVCRRRRRRSQLTTHLY